MELKNMTEIYRKKDKVFYRDGNKLIKLFEGNYPKENILNEALNQARVERTTLHIPRIEAVTSVEGKWAIVMEYIEGETLAALMKKNPSKEEEYLGTLAELQTEISAQRVPLLPRLKDKMYEKISASEYSDTVKYDLQTRLDGLPKHYKLCHGDFRPSNVIVRGDGTFYIVDWAHATQGNAAADASDIPPLRRDFAGGDLFAPVLRKDGHRPRLCGTDSSHRGGDADGEKHRKGKGAAPPLG